MRIALLGGAFNPVHVDHVRMGEGVVDAGLADFVGLMPCFKHKLGKEMVDVATRMDMVRIACNATRKVFAAGDEIKYQLDGSTHDLFANHILPNKDPRDQYSLVIGLDNARTIQKWHRWQDLLNLLPIIVVRRAFEPPPQSDEWFMAKQHFYLDLGEKLGKLSSTYIRDTIKTQGYAAVQHALCPKVYNYIVQKQLYK